jgi:hypothetical protein
MEESFQKTNPSSSVEVKPSLFKQPKLWLIIGGAFLIGAIGGLYFWWQHHSTDHLIELAPVDSVLYVQARNSFWPWSETTIKDLPLGSFYQRVNEVFESEGLKLKDNILPHVSQAAFILLPNQESDNLDWGFIFKLKKSFIPRCWRCADETEMVKTILLAQPNHLEIRENVLAMATSPEALEKIKEVSQGSLFSLASQVDSKKMDQGLMNLYLDSDNLRAYLKQSQDLAAKIFDQLIDQDIYLTLDRRSKQWQFEIKGSSFKSFLPAGNSISYLPRDFNVFVSNINLLEVFKSWGEDFLVPLNQIADSAKVIYDFDLEDSLAPFLSRSVDLIIFNGEEKNILGFDYVMVLPEITAEQINNLEELVKIVLAQKLPEETKYVLPDGTSVIELLAEAEARQWQQESVEGLEISYLKEPSLNFEMSYLVKDDKLIISSSIERLKYFISTQDIELENLISVCGQGDSYLIFNIFSGFNDYLPEGLVLIREDRGRVAGCIVNL